MHKNDEITLSAGRVRPNAQRTGGGCDQAVPSIGSCMRGSKLEKGG
jgi:hypothetical protein